MSTFSIQLADSAATQALGARLARAVESSDKTLSIYLRGELGAGKTTLVQGLLRELGVQGSVRSPTYTLLESYDTDKGVVLHADLYRINGPRELEAIGLQDEAPRAALLLVEWPERGQGNLPPPDLEVRLEYAGDQRRAMLAASGSSGAQLLAKVGSS